MTPNNSFATLNRLAEQFNSRRTSTVVVESFFILFINMVSFCGNLLILIAVTKNANLRQSIRNMYIITIAVSDFFLSIAVTPFIVASVILGRWPFNSFVCQFQGFSIMLMTLVTLQALALTAVNRYYLIARSRAAYQKIFTLRSTKVMIALLWLMTIPTSLLYIVKDHKFFFHPGKAICTYDIESLLRGYGAFLVLFYVAIPLFIIVICYSKVYIAVRKHNATVHHRGDGETNQVRLTVEEVNVTYTLLFVVVGFLMCWTPVLVIDLIDFVNGDWLLPRAVYFVYTCCGFASTAVNPVIYGIRNRAFRREYWNILTCS